MIDVPLSPVEAALGAEIDVPVLDGARAHAGPAGDAGGLGVPAARQGLPARARARAATRTSVSSVETPAASPTRRSALLEKLGGR